jgi:uncharacterized protein (DUF1697 family)
MVALLKGVNVGGHNKLPMAELRAALGESGFGQVRTLLQSGNVVLDCPRARRRGLPVEIESILHEHFAIRTKVVVRDVGELAEAIASDPLIASVSDPARHLVGFASGTPAMERSETLNDGDFGDDLIRVVGGHVYMWCPKGLSASPFFKMDLDRLLGVTVTARNWRTVNALHELARG